MVRHRTYGTTERYINVARQLKRAADGLDVPEVLRNGDGMSVECQHGRPGNQKARRA